MVAEVLRLFNLPVMCGAGYKHSSAVQCMMQKWIFEVVYRLTSTGSGYGTYVHCTEIPIGMP